MPPRGPCLRNCGDKVGRAVCARRFLGCNDKQPPRTQDLRRATCAPSKRAGGWARRAAPEKGNPPHQPEHVEQTLGATQAHSGGARKINQRAPLGHQACSRGHKVGDKVANKAEERNLNSGENKGL